MSENAEKTKTEVVKETEKTEIGGNATTEMKKPLVQRNIVIIKNKPDEPAFQLQFALKDVRFLLNDTEPVPSFAYLKITNPTQKKQCVKLKSTKNALFRIQPTFALIEPNESLFVKITLIKMPEELPPNFADTDETKTSDKRDCIGVYHIATENTVTTIKEFKEIFKKPVEGMARVCISYAKLEEKVEIDQMDVG